MTKVMITAKRSFNDDEGNVQRGQTVPRSRANADYQIGRKFAEEVPSVVDQPAAKPTQPEEGGEKSEA